MNKRSFQRRNALVSGLVWPLGFSLVGVALLILLLRVFAPGAFLAVLAPVQGVGTLATAASSNAVLPFTNTKKLTAERDQLRAENAALMSENETLKATLRDTQGVTEGVVAGVMARPPMSPYDTLVLSSQQTLPVGSLVLAPGGAPIGRIEESRVGYARAMLFSTSGATSEGWAGEVRLPISLIGEGGGGFSATLAREAPVAIGDVVYLPGPGARAMGSIVRIDTDPASPSARVHVRPFTNPFSLTWVSVVSAP